MSHELFLFRLTKDKSVFKKNHLNLWNAQRLNYSFIFLFFSVFCAGHVSSSCFPREQVLDAFFRDLVGKTTAGYVLYGEKPVDLQAVRELEQTMPGTEERRQTILTLIAKQALQECPHKMGHCLLCIHPVPTGYEILSINLKAFQQTLQTNLLLFTSRFGLDCTPQSILNRLMKKGFGDTFKKCPALQGIVLGYGTENAISYEIGSSFLKPPHPKITPPFKISPKYKNLDEQIADIGDQAIQTQLRKIVSYKAKNQNDKTKIPFSYLADYPTTQKLILKYQNTQIQTEKALASPRFLSDVCNRFGIILNINRDSLSSVTFSKEEETTLSSIVARFLLKTFPNQISPEFILGMKNAVEKEHLDIGKVKFLDVLWQRDSSLTFSSDLFFKDLAKKAGIECKIPGYLYIENIQTLSSGEQLTSNHQNFRARYLVQDFSGSSLNGSYGLQDPPILCLEELIPGLAHGLIGMRKGEVREIYIHPDIAYGPSSETGQRGALVIRVELLDLGDSSTTAHLPSLEPFDAKHYAPPIRSTDEFASLLREHAYACGFRSWSYYKHAEPFISLEGVLDNLSKEVARPLSAQEKMTLLKLEWLLSQDAT